MRLFIDNKEADIDAKTEVIITISDSEFKINTISDEVVEVPIILPMTPRNAKIFGYAYDPNEEKLFNNEIHSMILKKEEAIIFAGTIILVESVQRSHPQIAQGYFKCKLRRTQSWINVVKQKMFNEIPIQYEEVMSSATIKKSWAKNQVVKFLPVRRDRFHSNRTTNTFVKYEQIIPAHAYHPFLHIKSLVESMVGQAGYELNSEFMNEELFNSMHISGNYILRSDTTASMKKSVEFCAGRLTTKEAVADEYGEVYANPLYPQNSFGAIVETADPNEEVLGEKALGVFNTNGTFKMQGNVPSFVPGAEVNVAFEYNLSFNSEYEIKDKEFLTGFDTIIMNDGLKFHYKIPNSFTDHRKSFINGQKYWIKLFGREAEVFSYVFIKYLKNKDADLNNLTPEDVALQFVITIHGTQTAPIRFETTEKLLEVVVLSQNGVPYPDDWAMYSERYSNRGDIDVGLIFRTNFERLTASEEKLLYDIRFAGAKPGMKFTIGRKTTVRPILLPHPGLGSKINFPDVAAHQIRQFKLLEAIAHLYNFRFYTDFVNKIVYAEPRDMIYKNDSVDWSSKVDTQKPIIVAEMGAKLPLKRVKLFKDGDGVVAKHNINNRSVYGSWEKTFTKYFSSTIVENDVNPLFTATLNVTNEIVSAPSASIINAGDRARHSALLDEELNFVPKIVAYVGLVPLRENEKWGYPSYGTEYPYVTFFDKQRDISLRFDDDYTQGLHKYFDKEDMIEELSREITLNIWLTPQDVEAFVDTYRVAPNFRSLFIIKIGDEKHRLRMKEIKNYNPNSGDSTQCVFFKEL